jgi:hypothetical protein
MIAIMTKIVMIMLMKMTMIMVRNMMTLKRKRILPESSDKYPQRESVYLLPQAYIPVAKPQNDTRVMLRHVSRLDDLVNMQGSSNIQEFATPGAQYVHK